MTAHQPTPPRGSPTTAQERAELRRLADAATAGEWTALTMPKQSGVIRTPNHGAFITVKWYRKAEDLYFIAAARTAVPRLLDRVEELEREVEAVWANALEEAAKIAEQHWGDSCDAGYNEATDDIAAAIRAAQAPAARGEESNA